jgi:hypothetical protein
MHDPSCPLARLPAKARRRHSFIAREVPIYQPPPIGWHEEFGPVDFAYPSTLP